MSLKDTAIIAHAELKVMERSDRDVWQLGAEVLEQLLDRSGLEKREIDGLAMATSSTGAGNMFWPQATADMLGLELDYCDEVMMGGCSPVACVARAAAAINAGLCTTVLILYADTGVAEPNAHDRSYRREWTEPYGLMGPPGGFGLLTRSYEQRYGLDYALLGKLAVTQRNHALLNDMACEKLRKPITVADYLGSRMIAEPIRLLDCVMRADGAAGLILTSRKRAKEKGIARYVVPTGYAERVNYRAGEAFADPLESGHVVAGPRALKQAGIAIGDIASFHPYDDFLIAMVLQMEALGFCRPGEGMAYVRDTNFAYDGDLPLNTGGGQISAGQAACSSENLVEAVEQLMGEAGARQVRDTRNALVTGIGWINYGRNWGASAALVLEPGA